ncbi:MAG: hypothetical protein J0L77_07065 [Alphaproteobacteria bacterium]|nr:hypothetical protein [Alphaproteobacteria bacterium]
MKLLHTLLVGTALTLAVPALAQTHDHEAMGHDMSQMESKNSDAKSMDMGGGHDEMTMQNAVKFTLSPDGNIQAGKTTKVTAKLTLLEDGSVLGERELKEAHTRKLHLLVVDPTLTDYHHIHPTPMANGEWSFDFTPLKNGQYRVWADVIPVATGKQEYIVADIGMPSKEKATIDQSTAMTSTVDGYTFTLALEGEPKAGAAVMGNVTVTKDGKPFTQLEPVMGAFAHVVGFTEDYKSVLHIHPMGKEPTSDAERGGPKLEFHIEPEKAGFVKLFAQVRIDGKDVFAPFGITVK